MQQLHKSLDALLKGDIRVAIIKGNWGVGKTFFWNKYIAGKIAAGNLTQIAYSYVSLFGKTTIPELRSAIFQTAEPIASKELIKSAFDKQIKKSTAMSGLTPWIGEVATAAKKKLPFFSRFSETAKHLPFTSKYSGLIQMLECKLVNNYIICLDDLERKGSHLSVKEIMGLIDELADRNSCKVILIYNENTFSETDKKEFDTYNEKVVDLELTLNPTFEENILLVVPPEYEFFEFFKSAALTLQIKNIRILKKARRLLDEFAPMLSGCDASLRCDFVKHAILLSWAYYLREQSLSFEFVKNHMQENPLAYLFDKSHEPTEDEKRYRAIVAELKLSPSSLQPHIVQYLETGYADFDAFSDTVASLTEAINLRQVQTELQDVWKLYGGSFSENETELIKAFKDILERHRDKFSIGDFTNIIHMLEMLGQTIDEEIAKYISIHAEDIRKQQVDWSGVSPHPQLVAKIRDIQKESESPLTIDGIISRITSVQL